MSLVYTSEMRPKSIDLRDWVKELRAKCPQGSTVRLGHMVDNWPVPDGTRGTLDNIDDIGQFHTIWEGGRYLAAVPGVDTFTVWSD